MNVRAQFLYEIQGTQYINPDVLADIKDVKIVNTDQKDRVLVSGARGTPPPSNTKAITVAIGGYQAEATFYMNGLDLDAKERFMRQQIEYAFKDSNFKELSIERYGAGSLNPSSQALGTVFIRVLVKGEKKEDIREDVFRKKIYALRMQFYAGKTRYLIIYSASHGIADVTCPPQDTTCHSTFAPCRLGCLWSYSPVSYSTRS